VNRKPDYAEARQDAIKSIRGFLDGTGGDWDWDDYTSVPTGFSDLEELRQFCVGLPDTYPPSSPTWYCNEEGLKVLRRRLDNLECEKPVT
jgi:hypothetical protein